MSENSTPNSGAPVNTQYFSENFGIKIGSLESDVRNVSEKCNKLEERIKPLEVWKTELVGGWKATKWLVGIFWVVGTFAAPIILKHFGII